MNRKSFSASLLATGLALLLMMPTYAQSSEPSSAQNEKANNTIFLPLVAGTAAQAADAGGDLTAESVLSEAELLSQSGPQVQAAAVIATNGKIAFSSIADGDADIYTMNSDGTGLVNITNSFAGGNDEVDPKWSPDGSKILFVSRPTPPSGGGLSLTVISDPNVVHFGRIGIMNADGTNPIFLTTTATTDAQPEWSPDGTKIAFTSVRENDYDIYIMNTDGSNAHNLLVSEPPSSTEYYPAWSPDGSKILYIAVSGFDLIRHVATIDAAGVGPQTFLTSNYLDFSYSPQWSSDGRLIVYNYRTPAATVLNTFKILNADGSNLSPWTVANLVDITSPDFSPDGKLITLVGTANGSRDLYALPAPLAPLAASTNVTATATRITTIGGVVSADWQKKWITTYTLSVSKISQNGGAGVVTSQPSGINCGTQCAMDVVVGTRVTLTATPSRGSKFAYWGGACSGKTTTCTVTVDQQRAVVAYFRK